MGGTQTLGNLVVGSIEASVQSWFVQFTYWAPLGLVVSIATLKFIFNAGIMMPRH